MVVVVVIALLGMVATTDQIGELVAPPATSGSDRDASPEAPAEQAYLNGLDPYLTVVIGEGKRLAELGQARSRNLLELGVRMDRFRVASADLESYIAAHAPPAGLQPMIDDLLSQLAIAESAIQASIAAIQGFDWDSLGMSVDEFSHAVHAIDLLTNSHNA
jgi:hypothetical protein